MYSQRLIYGDVVKFAYLLGITGTLKNTLKHSFILNVTKNLWNAYFTN